MASEQSKGVWVAKSQPNPTCVLHTLFPTFISDMEDTRLASLIDMYAAGVISAEELVELQQRLASSAAAREQFDRHVAHYEITHPHLTMPRAEEFLAQWDTPEGPSREEMVPVPAETFEPTRIDSSGLFRASFCKWRPWSIVGTAAAFLAVFTITVLRDRLMPAPSFEMPTINAAGSVATLRHAADVQWIDLTNEIFVGHVFGVQRVQLAAGALQLDFQRGARLVMEGPTDLQLISDNEAFLHSGKVTAHVPDEAHGFKITTRSVAVTDLGTEFGLRATTNAPAEVHVFSGLVEMQQPTTGPRQMTQGQAVKIQRQRVRTVPANRNVFLFENESRNER